MVSSEPGKSMVDGAEGRSAVLAVAHGGLSEGIRGLLSTLFESVVLVADERSLTACLDGLRPDLLVLDLAFVPRDGIDLATRLKWSHPGLRILLLVADEDPAIATAAAGAGVDGCLLKHALGRDLLAAAEEVLAGGKAFWSGNGRDPEAPAERALPGTSRRNGTG